MKKLIYSLVFLSLISINNLTAQNFQWAQSVGSTAMDYSEPFMAVDAAQNVYLCASVNDSVQINGQWIYNGFTIKYNSAGVPVLVFSSDSQVRKICVDSSGNIFELSSGLLRKYDGSGALLFDIPIAVSFPDHIDLNDMVLDASGNVYIIGTYHVHFLSNSIMKNFYHPVIYKFDNSGNSMSWANGFGGDNSYGYNIAVDNSGSIIMSGTFRQSLTFPNVGTLSSLSNYSTFLCKADAVGNFIWADKMDSLGYESNIAADVFGNIWTINQTSFIGNEPVWLRKFDSSGNLLSQNSNNATNLFLSKGMIILNNGNIMFSGNFSLTSTFAGNNFYSNGYNDFLLINLDSSGYFNSGMQFGNTFNEAITQILSDPSGNIYLCGSFGYDTTNATAGTINFGTIQLTSNGYNDFFVARLTLPATGINSSLAEENTLGIFPNPASTGFQISDFNFQKDDEIILRDALGKISFSKKITFPTSNFQFPISNFPNGIYFLEVKTNEGVLNKKVVVQH